MAFVTNEGTFRHTNLTDESEEYPAKREELRLAEVEPMTQMERVSAMRRRLPPGPPVEDYVFEEGPRDLDSGDLAIVAAADPSTFRAHARSRGWNHLRS